MMGLLERRSSRRVLEELEIFEGVRKPRLVKTRSLVMGRLERQGSLRHPKFDNVADEADTTVSPQKMSRPSLNRGLRSSSLSKILSSSFSMHKALSDLTEPISEEDSRCSKASLGPSLEGAEELVQGESSKENKDTEATTTTTTTTSAVSPKTPKRSISFGTVLVHYHEPILGFNLGVSQGAPLELAWKRHDHESLTIDAHDARAQARPYRTGTQLKLTASARVDMLRIAGHSMAEITSRIEAVDIFRHQLAVSIKRAKMEDFKAAKQAAKQAKKANRGSSNSNDNKKRRIFFSLGRRGR